MVRNHALAGVPVPTDNATRRFVLFAFVLLLLLLLLVSGVGLWRVHTVTQAVERVVAERNLKTEIATALRSLHRERHQMLVLAAAHSDPFEQDEAIQTFHLLAEEFLRLRDKLLSAPLAPREQALWEGIRPRIALVGALSGQFIDKVREGHADKARTLLYGPLRGEQDALLAQWDRMVQLQQEANRQAVTEARKDQRSAFATVALLTMAAVLLGTWAACYVYIKLRRHHSQLHTEKDLARATLSGVGDAVIRIGRHSEVEYLNPAAERLLDVKSAHVAGMPLAELIQLETGDSKGNTLVDMLEAIPRHDAMGLNPDARLRRDTLPECDVEGALTALRDTDGLYSGAVLTLRDVSLTRESQRRIAWQASHDGLTGLANRRQFEERLNAKLSSKRHNDRYFSLMFVDLDNFKAVNDGAGHRAGDELLRHVANLMRGQVRDHDLVARLGGDEFGLLLTDCPRDRAQGIAQGIVDAVGTLDFIWQGSHYRISASVGLLHAAPGDFSTLESCLHAADEACYRAKRAGRAQVAQCEENIYRHLAQAS